MRHFPDLSTDEGAEELGTRWMETLRGDFEEAVLDFHGRYTEDLGELEATLEQFRSDEFGAMTQDELIRQFAHLWLVKIDHMVMAAEREGQDRDRR